VRGKLIGQRFEYRIEQNAPGIAADRCAYSICCQCPSINFYLRVGDYRERQNKW